MEYEKEDHALSALKEISNHDPLSNWGESVNCKRMRKKYFSKSMEEGKKKLPAVVSRKELSKDYDSAVYHDNRVRSYILLEKFQLPMQKFKLKTKTKQFWYKYYKRRIEPANENSSVQKWLEDKRTKCFSSLTLKSKQHALHERPLLMIHG